MIYGYRYKPCIVPLIIRQREGHPGVDFLDYNHPTGHAIPPFLLPLFRQTDREFNSLDMLRAGLPNMLDNGGNTDLEWVGTMHHIQPAAPRDIHHFHLPYQHMEKLPPSLGLPLEITGVVASEYMEAAVKWENGSEAWKTYAGLRLYFVILIPKEPEKFTPSLITRWRPLTASDGSLRDCLNYPTIGAADLVYRVCTVKLKTYRKI